jgi:hypothetical protein
MDAIFTWMGCAPAVDGIIIARGFDYIQWMGEKDFLGTV